MHRLLLAVALVAGSSAPAWAQANNPLDPPVIVAQGEAVLKRMPDRAFVSVSTEVREGKAADARRKSAEGMTALRAAIAGAGIPADAIRMSAFTLSPEMGRSLGGQPNVRNYVARNQIEVRVDDLDKIADVVDAANTPKNIAIAVGSLRYELKDKGAAETEAIRLAVQNALNLARAMAAGASQTAGAVLRIEQQSVASDLIGIHFVTRSGTAMRGGGEAQAPETPITPGEIEIRASVTVTVAIK